MNRTDERRPGGTERRSQKAGQVASAVQLTAEDDSPPLFDRTLMPSGYVRGPGPRAPSAGPDDAAAPPWWWDEAERIVLALVDSGHRVSSDDLHDRFTAEPSASGAAYGAVFARLARQGRIREVGMVKSRRPEARRRRIILWGAP